MNKIINCLIEDEKTDSDGQTDRQLSTFMSGWMDRKKIKRYFYDRSR